MHSSEDMDLRAMDRQATAASRSRSRWQERFEDELVALRLPIVGPPDARVVVTEEDLAPLPVAAQRYLRFMRVVGRPRDWSVRVNWTGRFRRRRTEPWRPVEAWQYDASPPVARVFHMRMRYGLLPLRVRDIYVGGHGHMLGRLADLVTVVDGRGEAYDIGELVTYLNDCVLFAPSMLLRPSVAWGEVDDASFDLSLTDAGLTVKARVWLDDRDAPLDFETTDRFVDLDGRLARTRWTTPVDGWDLTGERPRVEHGRAIWHLPDGPFQYADFTSRPGGLVFNVPPGAPGRR